MKARHILPVCSYVLSRFGLPLFCSVSFRGLSPPVCCLCLVVRLVFFCFVLALFGFVLLSCGLCVVLLFCSCGFVLSVVVLLLLLLLCLFLCCCCCCCFCLFLFRLWFVLFVFCWSWLDGFWLVVGPSACSVVCLSVCLSVWLTAPPTGY